MNRTKGMTQRQQKNKTKWGDDDKINRTKWGVESVLNRGVKNLNPKEISVFYTFR